MAKGTSGGKPGRAVIARNKRALRDYFIVDRYEAGMVLQGSEVKSLRSGRASLTDGHAELRGGELFLVNCNISEYPQAKIFGHEPKRSRKLLMHADQIRRIGTKLAERGYTLVPLELYFTRGRAKVELGLAKGKRQYDKRETVRRRDIERDAAAELRRRR